ncbi:receptor-like protein 35 [Ziziphus jujuba]|uniref:Receptor-like protein 35 n=1 Tax=Ziziphus jujuba TaxID=326968 RepID=A0ABM3IA48_ZIZJJ|nr:receptor-like protein 35 [Ziziphus jujuba]
MLYSNSRPTFPLIAKLPYFVLMLESKPMQRQSLGRKEQIAANRMLFNVKMEQEISKILPEYVSLVSLTHLNFTVSRLDGQVPLQFSRFSRLVSLDLSISSGVTLENSVLKSLIQNLTQLRDLALSHIYLASIDPRKLPNSIGNLKSLQYLDVSGCKFSGSIPASIGNLKDMWYLSLFRNDFRGRVPHSISNLGQLKLLALSENRLVGKIPNIFGKLTKLIALTLGVNHFTGTIPSSICQISKLQLLDLSSTLSGTIPPCLGKLTSLESFDVSNNHLVGPIPSAKLRKFHNESFEGNPGLCGCPLSKKCNKE